MKADEADSGWCREHPDSLMTCCPGQCVSTTEDESFVRFVQRPVQTGNNVHSSMSVCRGDFYEDKKLVYLSSIAIPLPGLFKLMYLHSTTIQI